MLQAGARLGTLEVLGPLGAGGMGEVYRARDMRLGREVALKVLPDGLSGDPDRRSRFEREARILASLNHPSIATIHGLERDHGRLALVMELVEGQTLADRLRRGPLAEREAIDVAWQIAGALEAAHDRGVVHRDLKPSNVKLTPDGRVKLLDFGLAKVADPEADGASALSTAMPPTGHGAVLGTAPYMSPEQARGQAVDSRTDIWAFGCVLYEMATGRRAFGGATAADVTAAILEREPVWPTPGANGNDGLLALARRCLRKRREDRLREIADARLELEALLGAARTERWEAAAAAPYPGLRAFHEDDAGRFFGREAEVEAVWQRLQRRKLLAVVGPSGAGKTSFVRAGIVASRPPAWGAIVFTPGRAPLRALAQALVPEVASDAEALRQLVALDDPGEALSLVTQWRRTRKEALVVVDQFEELFTQNPPDVQAGIAGLLGRLAADCDVHVLVAVRDDFLMRCHEHNPLARLFHELTPLGALTRQALRSSLMEPARQEGYRFEDEALVDELVAVVEHEHGALPLLAFAVARLWDRRDRERRVLTRAAYDEIGGVTGAIAQHAEATLERIGPEREPIVREVFRNLVSAGGTRVVADREELLSAFPDRKVAELVLRELTDARLLTSFDAVSHERRPPASFVQIVHESLAAAWPRLVRWRTQDADGALFRDQLREAARLWDERGRSADLLWTGTASAELKLWRARYPGSLTPAEQAFAGAITQRASRQRRVRRGAAAVAFATVLLVAAAVTMLWRRSEASRGQAVAEAARARASRVVALGQLELDRYPGAALAYALKSLEIADTPEGRLLALDSVWRGPSPRVLSLGSGYGTWRAAFSPDGSWLATYPFTDRLLVFHHDGRPGRAITGVEQPSAGPGLAFTPGGDALLARAPPSTRFRILSFPDGSHRGWLGPEALDMSSVVRAWPVTEGILFATAANEPSGSAADLVLYGFEDRVGHKVGSYERNQLTAVAVSADGTRMAVARGRRLYVRPVRGPAGTPEEFVAIVAGARIGRLSFTPRGDVLAAVDDAGRLTMWPVVPPGTVPLGDWPAPQPHPLLPVEDDDIRGGLSVAFSGRPAHVAWGSLAGAVVSEVPGPPDAQPQFLRYPENTRQVTFDPLGRWAITLNRSAVAFWPIQQPRSYLLNARERNLNQVEFTSDSRWLASCGSGEVRLWPVEAAAGRSKAILLPDVRPIPVAGTRRPCYGIAMSPNGRSLFIGGPHTAFLADLGGRSTSVLADGPGGQFPACAFDPSGRRAAGAPTYTHRSGEERVISVWDLVANTTRRIPLVPAGETAAGTDWGVSTLAFMPSGALLAAGSRGIRRFDIETGRASWCWRLPGTQTSVMAVTGDGRYALAAAYPQDIASRVPGSLMILTLESAENRPVTSHGNRVRAVAVDRSARVIVTGDTEGTVRVGRFDGGEPHVLLGHQTPIRSVAVSPNGRWIASADSERIRLWRMPDVSKPPLHTLDRDRLITKLQELTNLRVTEDADAASGYRVEIGPFPGWQTAPTW